MTRGLLRQLQQHGGQQHVLIARGSISSGIFAPPASSICRGRLHSTAEETLASGRSETEAEFWALRESPAMPVDRWVTWPEYAPASSVVHGNTNRDLVEQPMGNSAAPACLVLHQRQQPSCQPSTHNKISVHGRLKPCVSFWRGIGASEFVLKIIECGYFLCFTALPPPKIICNSPSVFSHAEFVSSHIRDLYFSSAVEEAPLASLVVVSPLGVLPKKNGKLRLILDLRYVNQFLADMHFSFENLRVIPQLFQSECFMFTIDLKDGYLHISGAEAHRKYLGFSWPLDGTVRYFRFAALPFGLKPAPFVFTKVLRPLVAHWRSKGLRIFMFLDDGTGDASPLVAARQMVDIVRVDLTCAGWLVNESKSDFHPKQRIETLGHIVDSTENWIRASPTRVDRLLAILERLHGSSERIPVSYLARLAGSIVSMWMALGSISRLQTRSLHALIPDVSAESWSLGTPTLLLRHWSRQRLHFGGNIFTVSMDSPSGPAGRASYL